ncbi:putative transcription factor C2H2 family [Helianthus annuus]|nr:putative transcription factor C2H2 family [Helianthus annuus]
MGCFCLKRLLVKQPTRRNDGDAAVALLRALDKETAVRFEAKPKSEQEDILIYLSMNWKDLQQDSSVIEALKETSFVTSADGDLHKPKDLFDPGDSLLTSLFSDQPHKFPGKRFVSDRWLGILRNTGLQNMHDPDIVLQCARRIEFLGAESMTENVGADFLNQVSLEIWSLAETLIKTVLENSALLHDHSFCSVFGKIACVPAEKGFPFKTRKRGVTRVLCSYSDAILLKDWPLAWSVAPILSKVPPEYSWGAFLLRSPPPFTMVLEHLQQQLKTSFSPSCFGTLEEGSFEVLKYLDTHLHTLSSSDVSKLSKLQFILTPNWRHMVSPKSLVTHLKINLWPIAEELPLRYLPFVKVLKELGLHDTLSISNAMIFLSRRRRNLLNPNELRVVIELLNFICDEIEQHKLDRSTWESELVVPDNDCRLVHPNMCLYIDPFGSQYVKYIDSSKLRLVHHDVSERMCLAFGIRKISDAVVEELDSVGDLETLEEIGSVSLPAIRLKLLSKSFQVAVSSVVSSFSSITSGFKNPDFPKLERTLDAVAERLQFVKSVYTRFWLLPKSLDVTRASMDSIIPEWEPDSRHRALYYVDRSNTCMLIAEPPSYVSVFDLVAIVVSHVLGSPVPLPIASLFLCPQDSETELVNVLKLSSGEREMDSGTVSPGREILPQDAMQVQLKPLRPFYKGEIVAWQSENGEKLKYGRITEDVRPTTGQAHYRLCLETSPQKTETIISSHVFWFGNFSMACNSTTYRHTIKELEHGRVPDNEFVEAVDGRLSIAGINMDTDNQRLHQKTLSLQERLDESQAALVLEQKKSEMARKEVDTAEVGLLCRICLTNKIDSTVVPCGHVLCHQCLSLVSRCPFCRVQFATTIRIHQS